MNNKGLVLDASVMDSGHYKIREFKKSGDVRKLLEAIEDDPAFVMEDDTVRYIGKTQNSVPLPPPQQINNYHPLGYPQVLTNFDRASVNLTDMYRGCTGFLVLSGPSVRDLDLSLLSKPGLLKMCVNNSSVITRPNLWTCVDPPDRFLYSVWTDPTVMKFVPESFRSKSLWDTYEDKPIHDRKVGHCPNVFYYERNNSFVPGQFFKEPSINWGQGKEHTFFDPELGKTIKGTRSCMLVALRIMAMLGVRTVYLVGADFNMSPEQPYAFDQGKGAGGATGNNNAYRALNSFFNVLKPHMQAINMHVYNTNPESGLKSFEYVPYEEAIANALKDVGEPAKELTAGMYDKLSEKKKRAKKAGKDVSPPMLTGLWDPETYTLIAPADLEQKVASEKPPLEGQDLYRAQRMRYDYVDILNDRKYWKALYPAAVTKACDTAERSIKAQEAEKGSCAGCARRKIGKRFAAAVFSAINADPETLTQHDTYRPDIMMRSATKFVRLSEIAKGHKF